eukprot:757408-Hanusia_phi.AAC.10
MQELNSLNEALESLLESDDTAAIERMQEKIAQVKEEVTSAGIEILSGKTRRATHSDGDGEHETAGLIADCSLDFDDSSVSRYTCKTVSSRVGKQDLSEGIAGIAPIANAVKALLEASWMVTWREQVYQDSNMKRIYTMSFRKGGALLAAGGHGGYAGVFGVGGDWLLHLLA